MRPLSKLEAAEGNAWRIDGSTIFQTSDRTDVKYTLDHVFGPDLSTQQIYEQTTRSLIAKVVNGFNSTVFAYGQTSSGKTFTMRGSESEAGLIPLAVHEVFELIEGSQDREFLIRVSYTEVCWAGTQQHACMTRWLSPACMHTCIVQTCCHAWLAWQHLVNINS